MIRWGGVRAKRSPWMLTVWILYAWVTGVVWAGEPAGNNGNGLSAMESALLQAVRNAKFNEVIDYGPYNEACPGASFCPFPALRIRTTPNVDVAVLVLDNDGQVLDLANVLLSRDYPNGQVAPIDANYGTSSVRWRRWDIARFDGGTFSSTTGERLTTRGWTDNPPLTDNDDVTPGFESAPLQFMLPYPASLFKIQIAYHVMKLVDAGKLSLDNMITCTSMADKIGKCLREMITISSNTATQALLRRLHSMGEVDAMNAAFADLGLYTLQINGTNPDTGGSWNPGQIHMSALDTARLFWLIDGANGPLWTKPSGDPVLSSELSDDSRTFLKGLLADQGFNEVLSNTNFCDAPNTKPGIPAYISPDWINPITGEVVVDEVRYGSDVRPCNNAADVIFGHKTGLTFNYGSDAGIVYPKSDRRTNRHYVIAFVANLGYRYTDEVFAERRTFPCFDAVGGICYTQRIPAMGKQIDDFIKMLVDPDQP